MERREWLVQVVVRASEQECTDICERIGEVICVPPDHEDVCDTPWTLVSTPVAALDEPERSGWLELLHEK